MPAIQFYLVVMYYVLSCIAVYADGRFLALFWLLTLFGSVPLQILLVLIFGHLVGKLRVALLNSKTENGIKISYIELWKTFHFETDKWEECIRGSVFVALYFLVNPHILTLQTFVRFVIFFAIFWAMRRKWSTPYEHALNMPIGGVLWSLWIPSELEIANPWLRILFFLFFLGVLFYLAAVHPSYSKTLKWIWGTSSWNILADPNSWFEQQTPEEYFPARFPVNTFPLQRTTTLIPARWGTPLGFMLMVLLIYGLGEYHKAGLQK